MASPVKTSNVSFALHSDSNNEGALKTKVKKDGNQLDRHIWTTNFFPFHSIRKRHHTLLQFAKMRDYEIGFLLAFLNNDSYFFSDEEIGFLGYLD